MLDVTLLTPFLFSKIPKTSMYYRCNCLQVAKVLRWAIILLGGTVWGAGPNIQRRQQSVGTAGVADAWGHSQVCRHSRRKWSPAAEGFPATIEQ